MKKLFIFILLVIAVSVLLIHHFYQPTYYTKDKSGQKILNLSFPIEKSRLITISDSLYSSTNYYAIPNKWKFLNDIIDTNFVQRIYYFPSSPEEMYLVTYYFDIEISRVYNDKYKQSYWQIGADISEEEKTRIKTRFEDEILRTIIAVYELEN